MHRATRVKITDLNPYLTCGICHGYYVDATTIIECLHSFCKSCIVRYLDTSKFCPVCEVQVHKTKPLLSIRSDKTLQDIVYKLVPGLFKVEMKRRRDYYVNHPEALLAGATSLEDRGIQAERFIYTPDEDISLSLEYLDEDGWKPLLKGEDEESRPESECPNIHKRYLRSPAAVTVAHLKKLIRYKYGLPLAYQVEIIHQNDVLRDEYTLVDVAYISSWRRNGPMRFLYTIKKPQSNVHKRLKTTHDYYHSEEPLTLSSVEEPEQMSTTPTPTPLPPPPTTTTTPTTPVSSIAVAAAKVGCDVEPPPPPSGRVEPVTAETVAASAAVCADVQSSPKEASANTNSEFESGSKSGSGVCFAATSPVTTAMKSDTTPAMVVFPSSTTTTTTKRGGASASLTTVLEKLPVKNRDPLLLDVVFPEALIKEVTVTRVGSETPCLLSTPKSSSMSATLLPSPGAHHSGLSPVTSDVPVVTPTISPITLLQPQSPLPLPPPPPPPMFPMTSLPSATRPMQSTVPSPELPSSPSMTPPHPTPSPLSRPPSRAVTPASPTSSTTPSLSSSSSAAGPPSALSVGSAPMSSPTAMSSQLSAVVSLPSPSSSGSSTPNPVSPKTTRMPPLSINVHPFTISRPAALPSPLPATSAPSTSAPSTLTTATSVRPPSASTPMPSLTPTLHHQSSAPSSSSSSSTMPPPSQIPPSVQSPKDSGSETVVTTIVPITTKDFPPPKESSVGDPSKDSVVLVVVASKEPPEIPMSNGSASNCHGPNAVSPSPPLQLPVPDISITPIPPRPKPSSPPSSPSTPGFMTSPSSRPSSVLVRDTLRSTNPQVEIIKKLPTTTMTSSEESVTTSSGTSSSATVSTTVTSNISVVATPTTAAVLPPLPPPPPLPLPLPPPQPPCTSSSALTVPTCHVTSASPVSTTTIISTITTDTTTTITITSTPIVDGPQDGDGEEEEEPKHDNIGALDLSKNSRGGAGHPRSLSSSSILSPSTHHSVAPPPPLPPPPPPPPSTPHPHPLAPSSTVAVGAVSTLSFSSPPPIQRSPLMSPQQPQSGHLSSMKGGSSTLRAPQAHSRPVPSLPQRPLNVPNRTSHLALGSSLPLRASSKPSSRNCTNGAMSRGGFHHRPLPPSSFQQQTTNHHQQAHHHHHHHHHGQPNRPLPKNILSTTGMMAVKYHRVSYEKPVTGHNHFHNGDKVDSTSKSSDP